MPDFLPHRWPARRPLPLLRGRWSPADDTCRRLAESAGAGAALLRLRAPLVKSRRGVAGDRRWDVRFSGGVEGGDLLVAVVVRWR